MPSIEEEAAKFCPLVEPWTAWEDCSDERKQIFIDAVRAGDAAAEEWAREHAWTDEIPHTDQNWARTLAKWEVVNRRLKRVPAGATQSPYADE